MEVPAFFIQIPQVLGHRVERVEAAVLADNEVDAELLVSLSYLLAWDLVPPQFPRQTVSAYVSQILAKNKNNQKCTKVFSTGNENLHKKDDKLGGAGPHSSFPLNFPLILR